MVELGYEPNGGGSAFLAFDPSLATGLIVACQVLISFSLFLEV